MNTQSISNFLKTAFGLLALAAIAFLFSRMNSAKAQTAGTAPSGTYVCLLNSNMSGYVANKTADQNGTAGINHLGTFTFDPSTPNVATMNGVVQNKVSHFENASLVATSTITSNSPVTLTVTPNTPVPYIYNLHASSGGVTDYYIGVANGGNSLFFMSAPIGTSTMNGACQKV
jgi:hypothetical protein